MLEAAGAQWESSFRGLSRYRLRRECGHMLRMESYAELNTRTAGESADARGRGHIYTTVGDGTQQYVVEECCTPPMKGYPSLR